MPCSVSMSARNVTSCVTGSPVTNRIVDLRAGDVDTRSVRPSIGVSIICSGWKPAAGPRR